MISRMIEILSKFSLQARRSVRGVILLAWIVVLVFFAGLAATGKASESVMTFFKRWDTFGSSANSTATTTIPPRQHLEEYLAHYEYPPPIEAIIDQVVIEPSWCMRDLGTEFGIRNPGRGEKERPFWIKDQYYDLFGKTDSKLQALVSDRTFDPDGILPVESPVIPEVFKKEKKPSEVAIALVSWKITREVAAWIKEERIRRDAMKQRYALVDTFFLLMVLGAFGSLIFLSKDYIERQEATSIASLVFRPILGMFLAMAVFIVSMFGHTVISTADILKVRTETLYLLALAAGMLSEQAYEVLSTRASAALEKLKEGEAQEDNQDHAQDKPQPPDPAKT
jgi:hypothetical protein